jgi:hypothetical protein
LTPISPSQIPSVPGNGRKWFALLMTAMLLLGVVYSFGMFVASLLL